MADNIIGKIKSIRMENFVAYSSLVFSPNEYLNVIVGPNGSGKSTIVAAIVIGLGGSCSLLSRSGNITDYIQNGKEYAHVVVTIYKDNDYGLIRFGRKFGHHSSVVYEIDGVNVKQDQYLAGIRKFNIQVDNLCQFLPQDRVQDFTRMNNCDLLVNTQASVCGPEMADHLKALKKLRGVLMTHGNRATQHANKLQEAQAQAAELEKLVSNVHLRQGMEDELLVCNARKAWLEYDQLFLMHQELTVDHESAKRVVTEKENCYNPLRDCAATLTTTKDELQSKITQQLEQVAKCTSDLHGLEVKLEQHEDNINKQKCDMENATGNAKDREEDFISSVQMLTGLVSDCKAAKQQFTSSKKEAEELEVQEKKLQARYDELLGRRERFNHQITMEITPVINNLDTAIASLEDVPQKKLKVLETLSGGAYQAVMWLRSNGHLFKGRIYEPMILVLNVPNDGNARYLENTIGKRDLMAFTCERTDDMNLFLRMTRKEMRLSGVNAIQSDPADRLLFKPSVPIEALAPYGFQTYLIDMVEGPFPVLNALCKLYSLHNVPKGEERSADHIDALPDVVRLFFTPKDRFSINVSRYTGDKSTCCNQLRSHNLLNKGIDQAKIDQLRERLNQHMKDRDKIRNMRMDVEGKLQDTQTQIDSARNKIRQCKMVKESYTLTKENVRRQKQKCEELQSQRISLDDERAKFARSVHAIVAEMLLVQKRKQTTLEGYVDAVITYETAKEEQRIYLEQNKELESKLRMANHALQSAKKTFATIEARLNDARDKLKAKNMEARAISQHKAPDKPDFPYREEFAKLPNTLDVLERHMEEIQARIECMSAANSDVVREYEQCLREIESLGSDIANSDKQQESLELEMKKLHQKWYPEITQVVQTISDTFSGFMESMGFAGEVELVRKDEHDYDQYGIQIYVKYRQTEKLQALNRQAQSGGERAVAIAVYTLALQRLSQVPFRCVDEINQGMDPTNERKVFNMLVDATCQRGQSQYFFVTPKLLPDLKMHELLSLSIVHNGRSIANPDVFENSDV